MEYLGMFKTKDRDGVLSDADSLPVVTAYKDGVTDGTSPTAWSNTLTVSNVSTGVYKVVGTIPVGYGSGTVVHLSASAVIGGATRVSTIEKFTVEPAIVDADVVKINGSTAAAAIQALMYAALETGTAQSGGASTITLALGATSISLVDQAIFIIGGTGAKQTNHISAYDTGTKVATVVTPWATQPDNTSVYVVLGRIE